MFEKKWGLGKIGHELRIFPSEKTKDELEKRQDINYISIDDITPNPNQPRKKFNMSALDELTESIKKYGVIQPINVKKIGKNAYELIAGERRLRASALAGLTEIPAIILSSSDQESAFLALIENLQRENLSFLEEAEAYSELLKTSSITQEELATKLGRSQSTIANKLRLLKLFPSVKKTIVENNLTERHARAVLKLNDEQLQQKVIEVVCDRSLNVKKTEELVEKVYKKYVVGDSDGTEAKKRSKIIQDVRTFVNTLRQGLDVMKSSGIDAKAAQFDRGEYVEFIIRVPKKSAQVV